MLNQFKLSQILLKDKIKTNSEISDELEFKNSSKLISI